MTLRFSWSLPGTQMDLFSPRERAERAGVGPRNPHVNLRPAFSLSSPGLCKGEMPGLPEYRHVPTIQKQDLEPGCVCPTLASFIHAVLPRADEVLSGLQNRDAILTESW